MSDLNVTSYDKLPEQYRVFVDALFENDGDVSLASKKAGFEKSVRMTEDLRTAILDRASIMISQEVPLALANLKMVLRGDPKAFMSATNRIKAAAELLDRAGLTKIERIRVEGIGNSLVILPPKNPIEK